MFKDNKARNRAWIVFAFLSGVILFLVGMALLAPSQIVVADDPESPEATETEDTPDAPTSDPTEPITTTETVTGTPSPEPATDTPSPEPATDTPSPEPTTETPSPVPTTETPSPVPATSTQAPEPPTDVPAPVEAIPTATPTSTPTPSWPPGGTQGLILGGVLVATAAVAVILLLVLRARRAPSRQPPALLETEVPMPGVVEPAQLPQAPGEGLLPLGVTPWQAPPYLQSTSNPQLQLLLERDTVRVGRAVDNDLVIDERFQGAETLSNHHARFEWDEPRRRWLVVDENSRNGVFVNGQRTGENVLRGGELIRLGSVEFRFHVPELGG